MVAYEFVRISNWGRIQTSVIQVVSGRYILYADATIKSLDIAAIITVIIQV